MMKIKQNSDWKKRVLRVRSRSLADEEEKRYLEFWKLQKFF